MESQPQNPEFRINPENFHPCMQFKSGFLCRGPYANWEEIPSIPIKLAGRVMHLTFWRIFHVIPSCNQARLDLGLGRLLPSKFIPYQPLFKDEAICTRPVFPAYWYTDVQTGLCFCCLQAIKPGFSHDEAHIYIISCTTSKIQVIKND